MVWNSKTDSLYIGGKWKTPSSDSRIDVISPYTEERIAVVSAAVEADIDEAVAAARSAFDHGPWPRMLMEDRIAILLRLRDILEARKEQLAELITDEMGSPITAARTQQAHIPILQLEAFISIARSLPLIELRQSATGNGLVHRLPKGVVAAIVPWNTPVMSIMMKLAPALLAGCCVIVKTSPENALTGNMFAEMLSEIGLPDGVVSILPADRGPSEHLALHPGVDKVSFTGSTGAGRYLAEKCGRLLRPITLELGGKSAAIILDDADIPSAIEALRVGSFRNSGQVCSLKTRILVSKQKRDEVVSAMENLMLSMPVGDPKDPETQIGPMVSKGHMERVSSYISAGIAEGAMLVVGGKGHPPGLNHGWFVRPTLFVDVDPDSTIAQEEIFGPVIAMSTYDDTDDAIAIANNSQYGLNGSVFSSDVDNALAIARRIQSGVVEINGGGVGFTSPIGGVKSSGIGREAGREGIEAYFEYQAIGLPKAYADGLEA